MSTAKKHKSAQDFKNLCMANVIKKVGGQIEADEILVQWHLHRTSEGVSESWYNLY